MGIELNVGPVPPEVLARGFRVVTMREAAPSGVRHVSGFQGRNTAVRFDVFDVMEAEALAAHKRRTPDAVFLAPFTPGQVSAARQYRAMTEQHAGQGVRGCLSSMLPRSGGGGHDAVDLGLALRERLVRMRADALAGNYAVLTPRRGMDRGNGRRVVLLSDVLDRVCLFDQRPAEVLVAFGWCSKTALRRELRDALRAALDRMQGYRGDDLANCGG